MLKSNPDSILMMRLGLEMWLSWFSAHLARTQPEVQSSSLHKQGEAVFACNSSIGEVEEGGSKIVILDSRTVKPQSKHEQSHKSG